MSWADFITGFFTVLQILVGVFLIFIILLQRGKGGGLVGALGGMGGASAFGPKADIHVLKLTIGLAIAWVVIACTGIYLNRSYKRGIGENDTPIKKAEKDATEKDATEGETKEVEGLDNKTLNTDGSESKAPPKTGTDKKAETEAKTAPAGEDGNAEQKSKPVEKDEAASTKPVTGEEKVTEEKTTEEKTTEKKAVEEKTSEEKK